MTERDPISQDQPPWWAVGLLVAIVSILGLMLEWLINGAF